MPYTFRGSLCGYVCPDSEIPLSNVTVRLYRVEVDNRAVREATASPKETFAILEPEDVERKESRLLVETETDEQGDFSVELDEDEHDYDGGPFTIDVRTDTVPGREDDPRDPPVQFTITTLQPQWRQGEDGSVWGWEHCLSHRFWCAVLAVFDVWVICGRVTDCETEEPQEGLRVFAFDADIFEEDLLGSAETGADGRFRIHYRTGDFRRTPKSPIPWPDIELKHGPDLFFRIEDGPRTLLDEDPSRGRRSDRENVGNCTQVSLCVAGRTPPPPNSSLWTGVGSAFLIPDNPSTLNDFTDDGYARAGSGLDYALTGRINLTGAIPDPFRETADIEYRFRVVEARDTDRNTNPWIDESRFDTDGRPLTSTELGSVDIGNVVVYRPERRTVPIEVDPATDVDSEGWINVRDVVDRHLQAALGLGFTEVRNRWESGSWFVQWDDDDPLVRVTTGSLPGGSQTYSPSVDAGDEAPDTITINSVSLRFEAREVDPGTGAEVRRLQGDGTTLNRMRINNNGVLRRLEVVPAGGTGSSVDRCAPLSGDIDVLYTAYHPLISGVDVTVRRNDQAVRDRTSLPVAGGSGSTMSEPLPIRNNNDPTLRESHGNLRLTSTDVLTAECTYIVRIHSAPRLHDGERSRGGSDEPLRAFFWSPSP